MCLPLALALASVRQAGATSMKMDYLRLTNVRTDPITHPGGLSTHVHSFYGASEAAPSTTYKKLRKAAGNTANVEENKSLYWHPTIYRYDKRRGRFTVQNTSYFSTYYIWPTGETTAFPDGFKMIGGGAGTLADSRPEADCSNPGPCPDGDCERWNDFFPATMCGELEMSMLMPSCWDGANLDSADHRSHVAYPKRDMRGSALMAACLAPQPDDVKPHASADVEPDGIRVLGLTNMARQECFVRGRMS